MSETIPPCPCGAKWQDGVPTNLEAAAEDALAWLRWIQKSNAIQRVLLFHSSEQRGALGAKLDGCIASLEEQLRKDA